MTETATFGLPLVEAAQAQKHVTVNEAFARIDALSALTLASIGTSAPPPTPADGEVHAVGAGASGAWFGADGALALFLNGGWDFVTPKPGWRAWSAVDGHGVTYDGVAWVPGLVSAGTSGGAVVQRTVEIEHGMSSGATSLVVGAVPANALILGVSARVVSAIGGAASMDIGVPGDADRFGAALGTGAGASVADIRATPEVYAGGADVLLTANGGSFDGSGTLRLAVHLTELRAPRV